MGSPASVSIDNNLATGEAGISGGTTNIKLARWVDYNNGVLTHVLRDHSVDDLLDQR